MSSSFYRQSALEKINEAMNSEDSFSVSLAENLRREIADLDVIGAPDDDYQAVYSRSMGLV